MLLEQSYLLRFLLARFFETFWSFSRNLNKFWDSQLSANSVVSKKSLKDASVASQVKDLQLCVFVVDDFLPIDVFEQFSSCSPSEASLRKEFLTPMEKKQVFWHGPDSDARLHLEGRPDRQVITGWWFIIDAPRVFTDHPGARGGWGDLRRWLFLTKSTLLFFHFQVVLFPPIEEAPHGFQWAAVK